MAAPEVWQLVLERVQAFEMPPKGKLDFGKHQALMGWLRELHRPDSGDCDQVASDRNTSSYHGYVMSRRLNRAEYNNTVRGPIGVDLHLQELLPSDGGGGEGFDTAGSALFHLVHSHREILGRGRAHRPHRPPQVIQPG